MSSHAQGDRWRGPLGEAVVSSLYTDGSLRLTLDRPGRVQLQALGYPDELVAEGWVRLETAGPARTPHDVTTSGGGVVATPPHHPRPR